MILVSEIEDEITFWGLKPDDIQMREQIDGHIKACYDQKLLADVKGLPMEGSLVLAPFQDQGSEPSSHRALIIKPSIKTNDSDHRMEYCYVRFVDYGNYKEVPQQALKVIDNECLYDHDQKVHIIKIPCLAVKYRLV